MKFGAFFLISLSLFGFNSYANSQTQKPYLISATFYISVDDWADISLNNIPIVDSQPRTAAAKGPKTKACLPEHLCYFKNENVLSIEIDDSTNPKDPENDYVGIAYILQLDFSDGTHQVLSSREVDQHKAYYIPDHRMGNPSGWQRFDFDDRAWGSAKSTGIRIPDLAELNGVRYGGDTDFLSASSFSSRAQHPGERHLFRRKFSLDISPNPNCDTLPKSPRVKPVVIKQPGKRYSAPPPPATPTATQGFRIEPMVVTQPDQRHPATFPLPIPTPTPTPFLLVPLAVAPTWTHVPRRIYPSAVVKVKAYRKIWATPTATSTIPPILPTVAVPTDIVPITAVKVIPPIWTPTFTVITPSSEGQTIVFDSSPANIYMSFADGPGLYRLEIFDREGRHLRNLFEKKVVAQEDDWAEWDGKNDEGQDAPPGMYYVVYSKGRRELRKMTLVRTGTGK